MVFGSILGKKTAGKEEVTPLDSLFSGIDLDENEREKAKRSRVFIVGCGPVGASVGMHLASAGIGVVGLIDSKHVTEKDIENQPLFRKNDLKKRKSIALADRLKEINPQTSAVPSTAHLRYDNVQNVLKKYDIVIDCSDNTPTHYLLSDTSILFGKTAIISDVSGKEGKFMLIGNKYPCYRCVYQNPAFSIKKKQSPLTNFIIKESGFLLASKSVKLALGGTADIGKVFHFSQSGIRHSDIPRNKDCVLCGETPTIKGLIDYERWCGQWKK